MSKSSHRSQFNAKNHASRALHIEYLESRELLSAAPLAQITPPAFLSDADDFTENVSSLVTTSNPAETVILSDAAFETPQSAAAPLSVNLEVPQIEVEPAASALQANSAPVAQKIVVNTVDDTVNNDRYTSLREAIQRAGDGAVITFASSLKGKTINLSSSLVISKKITIDASSLYDSKNDEPGLTFKTTKKDPNFQETYALVINGTKNVTIKGIKFTSSISGCGIYFTGQTDSVFNVQNCDFRNLKHGCWFDGNAKSAIANIDNCVFSNISMHGLSNRSTGKMNVSNCKLQDCKDLAIWNTSKST